MKVLVGRNIRAGRAAAGMTQRELSIAIDVDAQLVWRWENGRNRPDASNEAKLALLLFGGDITRLYETPEPEAVA